MDERGGFLFRIARGSTFLQNLVINIVSSIHPTIEHNVGKIFMLKRAFFHCENEGIEGGYFEFGVYEGSSLFAALNIYKTLNSVKLYKRLNSKKRNFYGFDSFDEGFRYFDKRDVHPLFEEGGLKTSFEKAKIRFRKFSNVHLIKGYFEETISGKKPETICKDDKCAIAFIDCDLMSPALISLNFIRPILQKGSVIILDDYWAYKGDPNLGVCGALNKFLKKNPSIKLRPFYAYGYGGMSFIVSSI